jgi:hypothetical protein
MMHSTVSAEFVDYTSLPAGSRVDVETKNRHYLIECLGGNAIRISGHPEYCPTPVPGKLQGAADKHGLLEPGLIGRGKYLQFLLDDHRPVTTSRVLHLHVKRAASSPSIHSHSSIH